MNIYSVSRHTWKWMEKLFFHLVDLWVQNSFILIIEVQNDRTDILGLLMDVLTAGNPIGNTPSASQLSFLDILHSEYWPLERK
jgi:hypothetical protein